MIPDMNQQITIDGFAAYYRRIALHANPYPDEPGYSLWRNGWRRARDEDESVPSSPLDVGA